MGLLLFVPGRRFAAPQACGDPVPQSDPAVRGFVDRA
jgi:hypothetical protein